MTKLFGGVALIVILLISGLIKFYYYNYVANIKGQARTLSFPGLEELICKAEVLKANQGRSLRIEINLR